METTLVHFPDQLRFTDDEFFDFCQNNPELKFERTKDGDIIFMALTGGKTGKYNAELNAELTIWNRKSKYGIVFDSSTGFRLPDTSVLSPDAAVVRMERWNALTGQEQEKFVPLCPEFVVEIKSPSDRLKDAQQKMNDWLQNGCQLAWLIDIGNQTVFIYRPNQEPEELHSFQNLKLHGENVLSGFALDLGLFL
jgi:Uma2 family endonuclease